MTNYSSKPQIHFLIRDAALNLYLVCFANVPNPHPTDLQNKDGTLNHPQPLFWPLGKLCLLAGAQAKASFLCHHSGPLPRVPGVTAPAAHFPILEVEQSSLQKSEKVISKSLSMSRFESQDSCSRQTLYNRTLNEQDS